MTSSDVHVGRLVSKDRERQLPSMESSRHIKPMKCIMYFGKLRININRGRFKYSVLTHIDMLLKNEMKIEINRKKP